MNKEKTLHCYLTIATKVNNKNRVLNCFNLSKEDRDELLAKEQIQLQERDEYIASVFEYYILVIE